MVTTGTPALSRGRSRIRQNEAGNLTLACLAEVIGTFMLVLVGVGTAVATAGDSV